ncbi:unnamed protein product [Rhizophagus irregularis]|uniref:Uncharacterized protein n=1 Tax=Rhizophagus irregularis TaxID=588596 RepID=A0A2N1P436_9GLOM|nr:hypothetical protein RhiirC2_767533 [Rhizophagus irregularis]CAB5380626.1 unnamed protein product [Rhizophagus irregularis]
MDDLVDDDVTLNHLQTNYLREWASFLEKTFLNFNWTENAKVHTYTQRTLFTPKQIENLLLEYKEQITHTLVVPWTIVTYYYTQSIQETMEKLTENKNSNIPKKEYNTQTNLKIEDLSICEYNEDADELSFAKASPNVVENTNENKEHTVIHTDTLLIYFAKVSPDGVKSINNVNNERIIVSYDANNKIVSIEILEAFGTQATLPLTFYPVYYKKHDKLMLYFVDINSTNISSFEPQETKEKDFEVVMDDEKIVLLLFHNVSSRIAKTLPEEEQN